jgi:hypothetical protein
MNAELIDNQEIAAKSSSGIPINYGCQRNHEWWEYMRSRNQSTNIWGILISKSTRNWFVHMTKSFL